MRKVTIFRYIRDGKHYDKIIGRETLRVITVSDSFIGIGEDGQINRVEFKKLADALEDNDGFSLS